MLNAFVLKWNRYKVLSMKMSVMCHQLNITSWNLMCLLQYNLILSVTDKGSCNNLTLKISIYRFKNESLIFNWLTAIMQCKPLWVKIVYQTQKWNCLRWFKCIFFSMIKITLFDRTQGAKPKLLSTDKVKVQPWEILRLTMHKVGLPETLICAFHKFFCFIWIRAKCFNILLQVPA